MIQTQVKNDVLLQNVENTTKMSISLDESNQAHIVKVLSENYKYPIASTVREAASNAWDSHVMSNKRDIPFNVKFYKNETGNYTLEVEDFGLGLDEEGFYKYYMKIGNSTKQGVEGVLGFFGCGAKSALSIEGLTNYEVICRKDGVENKFLIFKGDLFPECLSIHKIDTIEENGVCIKIPIDRFDYNTTVTAIKEQLCYFPTAHIQIQGDSTNYLEKKIFENELFSWSEVYPSDEMHINFGGVHYSIDWNILKIKKLDLPVGIKIAPDKGINPFFNRESLEYSTLCKQTLLERIKQVSEWFISKYNESNIEFKGIRDINNYYSNISKYVTIQEESFKINELEQHSTIKIVAPIHPKIKNLDLKTIYYNWNKLLCNYKIVSEINYGRFTGKNNKKDVIDYLDKPLYLIDSTPKKQIIDYLKEQHEFCYFVKEVDYVRLKPTSWADNNCYFKILELNKQPKILWRALIKDWQIAENELFTSIKPLPVIPKEWIDSRKVKRAISVRNQKLEGEINFKIANRLEKYSNDWSCKFVSNIINLKDFYKNKYLMVYGLDSQKRMLDNLYEIDKKSKSNLKISIVGERDYNKLKTVKVHNLVSMEDFIKEKHKIIAKYVTSYLIEKLYNENREVFISEKFISKNISTSFGKALKDLKEYKDIYNNPDNDLIKQLVIFCEENNFYDYPIYQTYKEVLKEISKISFIKLFVVKTRYYDKPINEEVTPIIKELLVSRKFKMDYTHYPVNVLMPETDVTQEKTILKEINN